MQPLTDLRWAIDVQARAEQDAYLAQLEAEGQLEGIYGKGVQVIQADPGVAVKTKTADGATRVYVNICTCAKVRCYGKPAKNRDAVLDHWCSMHACSVSCSF
jgi:hypothetical protein